MNNASKFGLKSGANKGEPWHVGMGDVDGGGIGDITDLISDFFRMFSSSPSGAMSGVAGTTGSMLGFLNTMLGGTSIDPTKLAFIPNVYEQMMGAAGGRFSDRGITSGSVVTGGGGGGGGGTVSGDWRAGFNSSDEATRAASAAGALYAAGFRGDALDKFLKIGWRESRWKADAHRTDADPARIIGDRGVWQINYANDDNLAAAGIISGNTVSGRSQLFDPLTNAKAVYMLSNGGTVTWPWGMSPNGGWSRTGDPLNGTQGGWASAQQGEALARQAGWIGDVDGSYAPRVVQSGGGVVFSNTFVIGGGGGGSGGGGIDARRTATLIADHLEDEVNKRLSRRS
jgi:hypothetical protein